MEEHKKVESQMNGARGWQARFAPGRIAKGRTSLSKCIGKVKPNTRSQSYNKNIVIAKFVRYFVTSSLQIVLSLLK